MAEPDNEAMVRVLDSLIRERNALLEQRNELIEDRNEWQTFAGVLGSFHDGYCDAPKPCSHQVLYKELCIQSRQLNKTIKVEK